MLNVLFTIIVLSIIFILLSGVISNAIRILPIMQSTIVAC